MGIVSHVMEIVFPVMSWLAKVMTRNGKVVGFLAGSFSCTCSGLVLAE